VLFELLSAASQRLYGAVVRADDRPWSSALDVLEKGVDEGV